MQTMKREDMEKEQRELVFNIGVAVVNAGRHVSRLLGAIGRVDYLGMELDKITPKAAPQIVEEKKDA